VWLSGVKLIGGNMPTQYDNYSAEKTRRRALLSLAVLLTPQPRQQQKIRVESSLHDGDPLSFSAPERIDREYAIPYIAARIEGDRAGDALV